jgi:hypothetical protein
VYVRQQTASGARCGVSSNGHAGRHQFRAGCPFFERLRTRRLCGERQWRAHFTTTLWEVSLMGLFSRRESEPQPATDANYDALLPRIGGLGDDLRRLSETAEAAGALLRKVMGAGVQIEITVKVKP